jgi:uncharacterized membrane protein YcaP (DUF421 family)
MHNLYASLVAFLGLEIDPRSLTFLQISLRGIIVFIATLLIVRLANKRFLAKLTGMDAIVGFILASMLARAVNGSASFFPTLGGGVVIVLVHRLLAWITCRSDTAGKWIKGEPKVLIKDGTLVKESMGLCEISHKDLLEELRLNGQITSVEAAELATLERNGHISVIPKKEEE